MTNLLWEGTAPKNPLKWKIYRNSVKAESQCPLLFSEVDKDLEDPVKLDSQHIGELVNTLQRLVHYYQGEYGGALRCFPGL